MMSCETQLLSSIDKLTKNKDKVQTDLIIMDFAKAFDKVTHSRFLLKLNHYGVHGKTNQWIKNFLSDCSQRVVLDGVHFHSAPVTSGVPPGTVLGPILFLIYINDLLERVRHCSVRLFADDCILLMDIYTEEDCQQLLQDINRVAEWETDWLMKFNHTKCETWPSQ